MSDNAWSPSDDQVKAIWELWRRQPEGSPGFAFADIRFHLETAARLGIVTPAPLPKSAQSIHKHTPACNPFTDEVNPNPGFCLEGVKLNVL